MYRGSKMKKVLIGTILLALVFLFPGTTMAGVDVGISIALPPLIVFSAPPEMVVRRMSMSSLTWMWTFFSTMVGGGVHGKGDGIARGAMVQVGVTIETFHLFIE
jgi:hypothetical protein